MEKMQSLKDYRMYLKIGHTLVNVRQGLNPSSLSPILSPRHQKPPSSSWGPKGGDKPPLSSLGGFSNLNLFGEELLPRTDIQNQGQVSSSLGMLIP